MDPERLRKCMSLGYSAKTRMANTIGQCEAAPRAPIRSTMRVLIPGSVSSRFKQAASAPTTLFLDNLAPLTQYRSAFLCGRLNRIPSVSIRTLRMFGYHSLFSFLESRDVFQGRGSILTNYRCLRLQMATASRPAPCGWALTSLCSRAAPVRRPGPPPRALGCCPLRSSRRRGTRTSWCPW